MPAYNPLLGITSPPRYNPSYPANPTAVTSSFGAGGYPTAKPLSRRDFRKKDRKFKNYGRYLDWWRSQPGHESWDKRMGFFGGGRGKAATTISPEPTDDVTPVMNPVDPNADPWDEYTKRLDERETALMEKMLRARNQQAIDLFGAMSGFGAARQALSAESWDRVLGGYKSGAEGMAGVQQGLADDYTLGLQQANEKIAQQFADIGQGGNLNLRDAAAAAQQVASAGGANPAGQLALVGDNWRSYAATVPGTMSLQQQESMENARREAIADTDRIIMEWEQGMLDNEEAAIGLWQTKQKYEWDVEDRATAKVTAAAKAAQEAKAFQLQIEAFNLKYGAEYAKQAKEMSRTTGYVYVYNPKTNQVEPARDAQGNKVPTEDRRKNMAANTTRLKAIQTTADTAKANRLSREEIARLSRTLKLDLAKVKKDEDKMNGLSASRLSTLAQNAGVLAKRAYEGVKYKDGTDKYPQLQAEVVLRQMRSQGIPLSIALDAIAQFAHLPNSRWAYAAPWRSLHPGVSQGAGNSPH